jgi:hypothetical protein
MTRWIVVLVALAALGCDDSRGQCGADGGDCGPALFAADYATWYECDGGACLINVYEIDGSAPEWIVTCTSRFEETEGQEILTLSAVTRDGERGFGATGIYTSTLLPRVGASVLFDGVGSTSAGITVYDTDGPEDRCQIAASRDGDDFTVTVECLGDVAGTDPPRFVGGPGGSTDPAVLTWTNCPLD